MTHAIYDFVAGAHKLSGQIVPWAHVQSLLDNIP